MPPEESFNPVDWLRIAEKDLNRVARLVDDADAEGAGFNLEQATEKFIKSYLLTKGWTLKKTHNLDSLLNELVQYLPETERFRGVCQQILDFYWADRYPDMAEMAPSLVEVRAAFSEVQPLFEIIKAQITKC